MVSPESSPSQGPPFREMGEKIGEGNFAEVRSFTHNPNQIVKEIRPEMWQSDTMQRSRNERGFILPQTTADIRHFNDFFSALALPSNTAAHLVPKTSFVLGHAENGSPTTFMVQDRIIGSPIENGDDYYQAKLTDAQKVDLCLLLDGLIDAYIATYDGSRGSTVRFEKNDNFIYGHKSGSQDHDQLYYIDVVPLERFAPDRMIIELNWSMANFGIDAESGWGDEYSRLQQKVALIDDLKYPELKKHVA